METAIEYSQASIFLLVVYLVMSNLLYSVRNVFVQQASELRFAFNSHIAIFAICCFTAFPFACLQLALKQLWNSQPMAINYLLLDSSLLAVSVISFVLYNLASFLVLMQVKPTMHVVLISGKRVISVFLACALTAQLPAAIEVVGMFITVAGVWVFVDEKRKKAALMEADQEDAKLRQASAPTNHERMTSTTTMIKKLLLSQTGVAVCICFMTLLCSVLDILPRVPI